LPKESESSSNKMTLNLIRIFQNFLSLEINFAAQKFAMKKIIICILSGIAFSASAQSTSEKSLYGELGGANFVYSINYIKTKETNNPDWKVSYRIGGSFFKVGFNGGFNSGGLFDTTRFTLGVTGLNAGVFWTKDRMRKWRPELGIGISYIQFKTRNSDNVKTGQFGFFTLDPIFGWQRDINDYYYFRMHTNLHVIYLRELLVFQNVVLAIPNFGFGVGYRLD